MGIVFYHKVEEVNERSFCSPLLYCIRNKSSRVICVKCIQYSEPELANYQVEQVQFQNKTDRLEIIA